uniref:Uncharacterized protein n=1 Tax=Romanomermis culicivorax TaxID=13658 RepID=A0A915K066_ROMCU
MVSCWDQAMVKIITIAGHCLDRPIQQLLSPRSNDPPKVAKMHPSQYGFIPKIYNAPLLYPYDSLEATKIH